MSAVAETVVAQRDAVAAAFAGRWGRALATAAANRMLDYAALVAAVYAVGGRARPSMVLLAYVLSLALALVPVTPGGLGFVEAGLTTILVLAGVDREPPCWARCSTGWSRSGCRSRSVPWPGPDGGCTADRSREPGDRPGTARVAAGPDVGVRAM